jgi:RNA polymerase sigma-70 factor, ECF subfamily
MKQHYGAAKELLLDAEILFSLRSSSTLKQKVAEIFELLRDPVYRYSVRALGSAEEAEDLTQDVFLRLYESLHKGQAVGNIRAWVFRVAHNLVIDKQRKKVALEPFPSTVWDRTSDPAPGAEERVLAQEKYRSLQLALTRLSGQERQCLELRAEGLSYHEIAEVLEMRPPTLVKYLGRIIRKLVKEITHAA